MRLNPQVPNSVKSMVFVLNTGDFGEASSFSCELTHPRTRPTVALWYLFNKYVYAFEPCGAVPARFTSAARSFGARVACVHGSLWGQNDFYALSG